MLSWCNALFGLLVFFLKLCFSTFSLKGCLGRPAPVSVLLLLTTLYAAVRALKS